MPKVKIVELYPRVIEGYDNYGDDYHEMKFFSVGDSTNWDEVTDEEYQTLRKWADSENNSRKRATRLLIVAESSLSPPKVLKDYLAYIKKEQEKREKEQQERAAKEVLQEKERKKKEVQRKKKQLAKLQKELGEA